ncbi:MAG: YihY/virulence factor BrkB family protein [Flavobacteriales bacterium]
MLQKLLTYILALPISRFTIMRLKRNSLPGFEGIPIYDVVLSFVRGLTESSVGDRAAAATFKFFMALFPTLLFICTLIPFVPIEGFQQKLLQAYANIIPPQVSGLLNDTIAQVVTHTNGGLLSVSVLLAGYFSTNGMMGLVRAMNKSVHVTETRSNGTLRALSFALLLGIFVMSALSIVILAYSTVLIGRLQLSADFSAGMEFMIKAGRFVLLYIVIYTTMSLFYLVVPVKQYRPRYFSPGAFLSTNIALAASWGVSFFFSNFDNYNSLYGAIGTFPILMVFIYVNCISVIVGFELNNGIKWNRINRQPK